jgi:hypothetical protein
MREVKQQHATIAKGVGGKKDNPPKIYRDKDG